MKVNKKRIACIIIGALIGAVYTALTFTSAFFGLAYGNIQFRISEALTIMPVFTPVAIPGLIIGCILSNLTSTLGPIDVIVGAEIVLLTMPEEVAFSVFLINALEVAVGEAAVLALLGVPLYYFIRKSMPVLEKFL